jgi:homoserine dehydrogenase
MKKKVGFIGGGRIARGLYPRIIAKGWEVPVVLTRKGVFRDIELTEKIAEPENYLNHFNVDAVCLVISTLDDGTAAFNYMKAILEKDIPVITSEKGALGNYFPELKKWLDKIGCNASVGGGSKILDYTETRMDPEVEEVHAIVNGTLNYGFDGMAHGRTLYQVFEEAKTLGYAEPGSASPLEIINKEACGDIPMKVAILFNKCFTKYSGRFIRAREISPLPISEDDLDQLIREVGRRRYIISITKRECKEDVVCGFKHKVGDWIVSGGFKNKNENPLFLRLVPSGVNNAILISKGKGGKDGTPYLSGEGAGVDPTTSVIMEDLIKLIGKSERR